MRLAIIENGVVKNVILGNPEDFPGSVVVDGVRCGPGWRYDGESFSTPQSPSENAVYLHVSMTGGDGVEPIGIVNDGVMAIAVSADLRIGPDPSSPIIPISGSWRVPIRDARGDIYDIVQITLTDGQANFNYTSDLKPSVCTIEEADLDPVPVGEDLYKVRLASPVRFKVYRRL